MATPAPNVPARVTAEQFLNSVVKKADISAYLSPSLRAQSGGDGSKLLGITGSITMFTIDSATASADGSSTVVHATITTAAGSMGKDFTMKQSGGTWQIEAVS